MHPVRPIRARLTSITSLVAVVVLLSACTSSPDAQPSGATSAPVSTTTGASSSGQGTGSQTAATGSSSASGSASSSALITGTTSVPLSSRSSRPAPSTPAPSGSAAVGSFDAGTVRYFAALCSGLDAKPRDQYATLTGDFTTKRTRTIALFDQQAERLDGAATAMKAAGTPNIPEGAKLASVTIATYPQMATAARGGAKLVATATSQADLDAKVQQASESIDAANEPLQDVGEIVGAPAVVGQMKKIAICASVLTG